MNCEPIGRFEWERIIRRARIEPSVKLVALILATYADSDGTRVHPGLKRLVNVTGQSRATVCRALAELRKHGLLDYMHQASKDGRKGAADEYRLTIPDDLLTRLPMLDPDENQVSPVRPAWGKLAQPGLMGETRNGQTDRSARSHQETNQVSPENQPGLTSKPHHYIDHYNTNHTKHLSVRPELEGTTAPVDNPSGTKLPHTWAGPVERAAARALRKTT